MGDPEISVPLDHYTDLQTDLTLCTLQPGGDHTDVSHALQQMPIVTTTQTAPPAEPIVTSAGGDAGDENVLDSLLSGEGLGIGITSPPQPTIKPPRPTLQRSLSR